MSSKTIKTTYWVLIIILVLFSLFDAYGALTHVPEGVKGVTHLGYPVYLMDINGVAKIIGVICLLQTSFVAIKEWAFAGYAISYICATWSHAAVGDPFSMTIMPVVFLIILLVTYYFWKKYLHLKTTY